MERVIAYIDGFNLYHGLKQNNLRKYYWLNVKLLIDNILKPNQELICVNYFTSRVTHPPTKIKRQGTFIEALETIPRIRIHYGHYISSSHTCRKCGYTHASPREKRTDVNIAALMLFDAFENNCDNVLLVSGDTDLIGPLAVVQQIFPEIKRTLAFPPGRQSDHLKRFASGYMSIGEDKLAKSLLPNPVIKPNGFQLFKPTYWP